MAGCGYQAVYLPSLASLPTLHRFLLFHHLAVLNDALTSPPPSPAAPTTTPRSAPAPLHRPPAHRQPQRLTNLASRLFRVIHPATSNTYSLKMSPVVLETPVINMPNAPIGAMARIQQFPAAQPEQPSNPPPETRSGKAVLCMEVQHRAHPVHRQLGGVEWVLQCPRARSFALHELWYHSHPSLEA